MAAQASEKSAVRAAEIQGHLLRLQTESIAVQSQSVQLEKQKHWQRLIKDGVEAFKGRGTPAFYVFGLKDLSEEEKENLWQDIFLMHKGRMPRRSFKEDSKNIGV